MTLLGNAPAGVSPEDWHDSENPLVPHRTCGSCTLCCKVYLVSDLAKPPGIWCPFVAQGKGCTIRPERPHFCRQFFCGWRLDPNLGPDWKPDRSRFVLTIDMDFWALMLTVDPGTPLAWKKEPYYSTLKDWAERAFKENKKIVVLVSGEATVVLPDRDVPLGLLMAGDEIVIFKEGPSYGAELRRKTLPDAVGDVVGH
jgi:Fe-S-cluster containining protein